MAVALWPATGGADTTSQHLHEYFGGLADSRWQRRAHQGLLLAIAALFLVGPAWRGARLPRAWALALPALLLLTAVRAPEEPFLGIMALCGGGLLALHHRGALPGWTWSRLALVAAVVLAVTSVPALLRPLDLSAQAAYTTFLDLHYGAVLDPGHRAAAGARLYTEVPVFYGSGLSGLVAGIDLLLGPGPAGRDILLVRISQCVAAALLAAAAVAGSRGRAGGAAWGVLAALAAFPASSSATFMPNVSGLRYLMFAVSILAFRSLPTLGDGVAAPLLGAVFGASLPYNPETGLAVLGGALGWVVVRRGLGDPAGIARDLGKGALGAVGAGAVLAAIGHALGIPASPGLDNLMRFAGGLFGLRVYPSPVVLAAAAHATGVLLVRSGSRRPSSPRAAGRAALASALLVWLAYFMNRPHMANELMYLVLWALLIGDSWPVASRRTAGVAGLTGALAAVVLAPAIALHFQRQLIWTVDSVRVIRSGPLAPDAELVSGVWLDGASAASVRSQAGSLRPGDRAWVSLTPWLVSRETGRFPELRPSSPFGDTRSDAEVAALVEELRRSPTVLLQDTTTWAFPPPMIRFIGHLRAELGDGYVDGAPRPGWIVLERAPAPIEP